VAGKIRTWVLVVLGVVLAGFIALVAVAGAGFYFFSHHIQTRTTSPAVAASEFDEVRARFAGQKPLVELDKSGNFVRSNHPPSGNPDAGRPEELHVLAFDRSDGRVVHITVPFWLLRLKTGGGHVDFNGNSMDLEDLRLRVDDLESAGPALIVDHRMPDGNRVLVWSQ
jgi:hypothetical protein